jgi:penicillin-binding protein-related factor A (putative recombinase)
METMTAEAYRAMIAAEDAARGKGSATRREAGRKARAVGQSFQDLLNRYHASLLDAGDLLFVEETKPPMRAAKVAGKLYYVLLPGGGPCDYLFYLANGRAGSFDAKSTDKVKTMSWPEKRLHQLATLRRLHELSGGKVAAFALVEWRRFNEVRLHPIWTIPGVLVHRETGTVVPQVLASSMAASIVGPAWHMVVDRVWSQEGVL